MLISSYDMDRAFDATLKRAWPYLIFPSQEFRDRLAEQMDSLCQYYRERNDTAFPERNASINKMLDEAAFDELTGLKIHYFEYQQRSVDDCLRRIEDRLSKIESVKKVGMKKKDEERAQHSPQQSDISPPTHQTPQVKPIDNTKSFVDLLRDFLKTVNKPCFAEEIAQGTGLSVPRVRQAARGKGNRNYLQVGTTIVPLTNNRGVTKGYKVAIYSYSPKIQP